MLLLILLLQQEYGILITDKNGIDNNYRAYSWGVNYKIQYKKNNKWGYLDTIIPKEEIFWNAIAMSGEPNNGLIPQYIDFSKLYGQLKDGTYRIVKSGGGGYNFYSNEFQIERN